MSDQPSAESKEEFKGDKGTYSRWMREIELSQESEEEWRKEAEVAINTYRGNRKTGGGDVADPGEGGARKEAFNILWANTETLRPALYNTAPRPDIRNRYNQKNPLARAISELLERCVSYCIEQYDMHKCNKMAVNDALLPGRAITRIKYIPTMIPGEPDDSGETEEVVGDQDINFQQWQWNKFFRGPAKTWADVTWICYEHALTKEQCETKWGDIAEEFQYVINSYGDTANDEEDDLDDTNNTIFNRVKAYEVWDKDKREVIWIVDGYDKGPVEVIDDPLGLKGFFDIPEPLYAIESSTSLVPVALYSQYKTLAQEAEGITRRIRRIIAALRVRGIYDSTIGEIEKLFDSDDNEFIPAEGVAALRDIGGLEGAIWMLPLEKLVQTLETLKQQRRELVQEIYEITGISDIMRGATNPHETKGAQQIKANFGSGRLKRQQEAVEIYLRDQVRLVVELIAENFSRESLSAISGMSFPTEQDKALAQQFMAQASQYQQQAQIAKQIGQPAPPPPDQRRLQWAQKTLKKPSWEDIEKAMKDDLGRRYIIDVETNSTIRAELDEDQKARTELLTSIGQFLQVYNAAEGEGFLDFDSGKEIILANVRQSKMGRQVEQAIENMEKPKPKPNPEMIKAQSEEKRAQQEHQMAMQEKQVEMQGKQREEQIAAQRAAQDAQIAQREHQMKLEQMDREEVYAKAEHERKMEELREQERHNRGSSAD